MSSDTSTQVASADVLPGEIGPLPMRYGGEPITDAEALGVARRLGRMRAAQGRNMSAMAAPEELPPMDANLVQSAHRLSPRLLMRVRAKAEMEGFNVTDIIREALEAYAGSAPGARVQYVARRPQR